MIVKLGDNLNASTTENHILDLIGTLADGSRHDTVLDTVFRCVVALPVKTGIYASLLGLLGGSNEKSRQIFSRLRQELGQAFKSNDYYAIKFLLRFSSELSNVNLISESHLEDLYISILEKTTFKSSSDSSSMDTDSNHNSIASSFVPQHIGDFYVTCIISAILLKPNWHPSASLLSLISSHMETRKSLSWLSPFLSSDPEHQAGEVLKITKIEKSLDSLSLLFKQFSDHMSASPLPSNRVILRPYTFPAISAKLGLESPDTADSSASTSEPAKDTARILLDPTWTDSIAWFDGEETPTDREIFELLTFRTYIVQKNAVRNDLGLEPLDYPAAIESCSFTNPKTMCHIFPEERTSGEGKFGLLPLERWFVEDYSADIIHFFRSTHAEIPKHLSFCRHLTDFFDFDALLCELILKDFLRVPASPYPPVHHGVLLLDMIQKTSSFQTTLTEATDRLFGSLGNLTSTAKNSFAEWFSYHLSNVEFKWTWKEWAIIIQNLKSSKPQVQFIQELVSSIIRLSYYERIVPILTSTVPEFASEWLPEKPEPIAPTGIYASPLALAIHEEVKNLQKPPEALLDPILHLGTAVPHTSENIIKIVVRAILVEGSSSITLLQTTLSRYHHVLKQVAFTGLSNMEIPSNGSKHVLSACFDYHRQSPQHFIIVVLTLLHHRIIDSIAVVNFLLDADIISQIGTKLFHWELITHAVRYVTQARSVLEAEITNNWILSCKSNPDSDPKALAESTKSITKESQDHLAFFSTLLHPLMMTVFSSLVDLLAHPQHQDLVRDHFVSLIIKHRHLINPLFPSLDVLVSGLSPDLHSLYQNLKYLSIHY